MKKLYEDMSEKGVEVVGITTYYGYFRQENTQARDLPRETEYARMAGFRQEHGITWPTLFIERDVFSVYGVSGIPHTVLIDQNGNVVEMKVGYTPEIFAAFRQKVADMIAAGN